MLLVDRLVIAPAMEKPAVHVTKGRIASTANLSFGKFSGLNVNLSPEGCEFSWDWRNTVVKEIRQKVRLRIGAAGAGRHLVVYMSPRFTRS